MWSPYSPRLAKGSQHACRAARDDGSCAARRERFWRPRVLEALEGRALLATTALDPTFGTSGIATGTFSTLDGSYGVAAIAVQSDGKVVTAEINAVAPGSNVAIPLVIHRYNANGSVDTSFGTDGQTIVPFSGSALSDQTAPQNLIITSSGQILVAAEAYAQQATSSGTAGISSEDIVARLTSSGQLDSTFGTGGRVVLPTTVNGVNSVAVESSGRILVAGVVTATRNQPSWR